MGNEARALWVRSILRANWRATVFLTLFAGIAACASMTAWQYSRRADSVIDRRIHHVNPGEGALNSCPPGADPSVDMAPCFAAASNETAYRTLERSPHVAASVMIKSALLSVENPIGGEPLTMYASAPVLERGDIGARAIIAGRASDETTSDEVVVSEASSRALGTSPGSTLQVRVCDFLSSDEPVCAESVTVHVVGVARLDNDLLPARAPTPGLESNGEVDFGIFVSAGWYQRHAAQVAGFVQTTFRLAPGAQLDDVRADMQQLLPAGWTVLVAPTEDRTTYDGLRQATRLQSRALLAVAVILLLASAVFVGQAIARQVRRELVDHSVTTALGMTAPEIVSVAIVRVLLIGAPAALLAVGATVITSGFGPPGLSGRAEVNPGVHVDGLVLAVGGLSILGFVVIVGAISAWDMRRTTRQGVSHLTPVLAARVRSPTAKAGMVLGRSTRGGGSVRTAVLGTAAAVVALTVAAVLVDSLHAAVGSPVSYGVSWQYAASAFGGEADPDAIVAAAMDDPLVTDAALVISTGPIEMPSIPAFWVISFTSVKGTLDPVIVDGRAPIDDHEVAVAPATLEALGKHIGDTVDSLPALASGSAATASDDGTIGALRIVGTVLVSDNGRIVGPGKGMLVTEATRQLIDPAVSPVLVVRTDPAVPPAETGPRLQQYGDVTVPDPQSDLMNLRLISDTPWVIALLVSALALAALVHSLVSLVRRSTREFGVLQSLGFTRGQVERAVCWHASLLAGVAILIGVPVGVITGRWGWDLLAGRVGLVDPPVVHVVAPILAAAALLVLANAIALAQGLRAGRRNVVESLRAE